MAVTTAEFQGRPWTVLVMIAIEVVGVVTGMVEGIDIGDLVAAALAALFAWGYWNAKAWAFILTFIGVALMLVVSTIFIVASLSGEGPVPTASLWGLIHVAVWLALLLHPATKRFWRRKDPAQVEARPPHE